MFADVRRWGNSLAVRIPAEEAEALGIGEGDAVRLHLTPLPKGKVDVSKAPFFRGGDRHACEHLDEVQGEAVDEEYARKRRR